MCRGHLKSGWMVKRASEMFKLLCCFEWHESWKKETGRIFYSRNQMLCGVEKEEEELQLIYTRGNQERSPLVTVFQAMESFDLTPLPAQLGAFGQNASFPTGSSLKHLI